MKIKCVVCGNEFDAGREDAKYCSPTCRSRASRGLNVATDATDKVENATDKPLSVAKEDYATDNRATDKSDATDKCVVDVSKMTAEDLYHAIGSYKEDKWVGSPEKAELDRRLKEFTLEELEAGGYWIPSWKRNEGIDLNK